MDARVEKLIDDFEAKTLSRRDLIASLTALVAGAAAAPLTAQEAKLAPVAQGRTLNHVSLAVTDVARSAAFYSTLLGLKEVSRPANGGSNLGLGTGFLGLYRLPNPGTVHHFCIGIDDYDPERVAGRLRDLGLKPTIDRNPANRTSGGDQLYFADPDNARVQLGPNGYQG